MPELDLTLLRETIAAFTPQGRSGLLPALHAAQSLYGWIPEPIAAEISRALNVPLADVHGVIEFYAMFYNEPIGQTIVRVCTDPACSTHHADEVLAAACRKAVVDQPGETSADGRYTIERSPCLGLCNTGVGVCVTHPHEGRFHTAAYGNVRPYTINDLLAGHTRPAEDYVGGDICIVTALCGRGHTASLIEYEAAGGMRALLWELRDLLDLTAKDLDGRTLAERIGDGSHFVDRRIIRARAEPWLRQLERLILAPRGARGGVTLARLPEEITLLEVVEAIDGPIALNECVNDQGACTFGEECPLRPIWCEAQEDLVKRLKSTNFAQFASMH